MIWQTAYQSAEGRVSWRGALAQDGQALDAFLQGPVAARLNDDEGGKALSEHLHGLSLTGMGQAALEEVLAAEVPEMRDWATGEALAEAVLESEHDVVLPWNCRVPCDYIPKRSYPLFRTRQILNDCLTQNLEEA